MAARKALFKDAVDEEDDEYCTRARCMDDGVDQRDPLTTCLSVCYQGDWQGSFNYGISRL